MRSRIGKCVVYVVAISLCCYGVDATHPRAADAQYSGRQVVFGPLLLAMMAGYQKWLAGPLGNTAAQPASFKATLDATGNPYRITFAPLPGYKTPGASYSVPASDVVDYSLPAVSDANGPVYAKGPLSLSGSYVRAYVAALTVHRSYEKALGDAYAAQNSIGSGVAIAVLAEEKNYILVGFAQRVPAAGAVRKIGCYKEQQYLVNPVTFQATKTRIGCPG